MPDKLMILVVDDEEDIQWLFKQRFRKELKSGVIDFKFVHLLPVLSAIQNQSHQRLVLH